MLSMICWGDKQPEKLAIAGINLVPHFTYVELLACLERYNISGGGSRRRSGNADAYGEIAG